MKFIAIVTSFLMLSGCMTTGGLDLRPGKIQLGNIDTTFLEKCNLPVKIPKRRLTQAEVEKYWGLDRKNLIICAKRHGLLGDAIKYRDSLIEGNSQNNK